MDRGANGGVAGNNVRVIATHLERTVDIRGVDNHETKTTTLIKTGAVTSTISGEFIFMLHQCAYH